MLLYLQFMVLAGAILFAGVRIARYGDVIAEKTGLGRTWVGSVLIGTTTSLPELTTGISSVTYAGAPDIVMGNVAGACLFNLLLLAVLDLFQRPKPLSSVVYQGHVLSATVGILLACSVIVALLIGQRSGSLLWVSPYSLLVAAVYVVAMKLGYAHEKRRTEQMFDVLKAEEQYGAISSRQAWLYFSFYAAITVAASIFLPSTAVGVARQTGLGQTIVGTLFVALSTTLPELVVSISATRSGAIDLAVGNIFGSNVFNFLILAVSDLFFVQGPLFAFVSPRHIFSLVSIIAMTAVSVIGLTYRAEKKLFLLSFDSVVIFLIYAANVVALFLF
ncbi:MAG: Inner membrane protein YrbG [Syntrophorhabdaceae bacterium PtaU1.Bin034]|nr:MAG: Inner membrane protein YrbG [Syntrophorhabdaceae bacterium PtaU1.Bin034]